MGPEMAGPATTRDIGGRIGTSDDEIPEHAVSSSDAAMAIGARRIWEPPVAALRLGSVVRPLTARPVGAPLRMTPSGRHDSG